MLITIIGRGHSGTRAMSHTLSASGVYMGELLNKSGDLLPPDTFYEACRVFSRHVDYMGNLTWDFSRAIAEPVDPEFEALVHEYLATVLRSDAPHRGWKLPETILALPWILRMFPDAYYIYWVRDPRDCILNGHLTDDLRDFGITYDLTEDVRQRRAISWKYQRDIYKATPKPEHLIEVRFEDFVHRQHETLARLETFLGFPLHPIEVRPESVGRWRSDPGPHTFDIFAGELAESDYA